MAGMTKQGGKKKENPGFRGEDDNGTNRANEERGGRGRLPLKAATKKLCRKPFKSHKKK